MQYQEQPPAIRHWPAVIRAVAQRARARLSSPRELIAWVRRLRPVTMMGWLWPFVRPDRRQLGVIAGITFALTLIEASIPLIAGRLIDQITATASGTSVVWWALAVLAAAAVGRGALVAQQQARIGELGERVAARIRARLWSHLQLVPLEYVRQRGGRLSLRFLSDTRMLQRLLAQGIVQGAQDIVLLTLVLIVLGAINWRLLIGIAPLIPVYLIAFTRINPGLRKASRSARRQRSRLSAYLYDRFDSMAMIKAYMRHGLEERRLNRLARRLARYGARRAKQSGLLQGAAIGAVSLSSVLVLGLAAGEIAAGRISSGELIVFYVLLGFIAPMFQRIAVVNRILQEAHISLERLYATLQTAPEQPQNDARPALQVQTGNVQVEQVSCRRNGRGYVLRKVSLAARRGELVAITGPNGAGKSTLLELLLGLRQPDSGRIVIDGQAIADVSLESLRAAIGFVPQDMELFAGSIAENVLYGVRRGIPEEQIMRAAALTGLDRLVARLPDGWQTQVGRGGKTLSGGQCQLIALARVGCRSADFGA